MPNSDRDKLMQEYVKTFFTTFRILEISGYCRFIIRNGKIVERNLSSELYNIFVVIVANIGVMIILWTANLSEETLTTIEFGTLVYSAIATNMIICQITFGDKYGGLDLMQNSIDLDCFLGADETKLLRAHAVNFYKILVVLVGFLQIIFVSYMYYIFFTVSIIIHIVGTTYFFWLLFIYNDFGFLLFSWLFLIMRARYINVALLKMTNMNMEHLPKQLLLHKLFWSDKYDDSVTFHTRAHVHNKSFCIAFKMLFTQVRQVERCYKFPITTGVLAVVLGTFVTVQTFILYIEASQEIARATMITGWAVASWFYILGMSSISDIIYRQIEQSKLICAYVQLKPSSSAEMLKLTKDILATLEIRDAKTSLYDVSIFDTGLVFKLAASTFVYITVQLQLAFPNLEDENKTENITTPVTELDGNMIKDILFLF